MLRFSHKALALGAILALPLALQPITNDFSIIAKVEAKGGNSGGGNSGGGNSGGGSSEGNGNSGGNSDGGGNGVGNSSGKAGSSNKTGTGQGNAFGSLGKALGFDGISKGQAKQAEIDGLIASLNEEYGFGFTNRGDVRSMLGSLNARNASPTAFANAAPDSQVGRIQTYTLAIEATNISAAELTEAIAALDLFELEFGTATALADAIGEATAALTEAQEAEANLTTNQEQKAQLDAEIALANSLTELAADLEALQSNLESTPEEITAAEALVSEAEIAAANLSANEATVAELQAEIDLADTVAAKAQDLTDLEGAQEQLAGLETALTEAEKAANTAATTEFEALETAYNKELEGPEDPVAAAIRDVFDPQPVETEGTEG